MDETIALAQKLIQKDSISPHDAGCQALINEYLSPLGFEPIDVSKEDVTNTYYKLDRGGPMFWFVGHTDVVPTGPEDAWTDPPFEAKIIDDTLYGRGSADMKGPVAAMVIAFKRFVEAEPKSNISLGLIMTSDEEAVAEYGVKYMAEWFKENHEVPNWTLVGEPSCSKQFGDTMKIGRRGSLTADIILYGKQGHIAYPQLADNPIHGAVPVMESLCSHEWDQGNDYFPPTSFQFANIKAGTGTNNVIPGEIYLQGNFRFNDERTPEELQALTESLIAQHCDNFKVDWRISGQPFLTKPGPLVDATVQSIEDITGVTPELSTVGGTSDGRFIAPLGGELVEFGPINASIHQVDEHVSCQDLIALTNIYTQLLIRLSSH